MLSEYEALQHKEYEEYEDDIPGLSVKLYYFQKKGVEWMCDTKDIGNGKHGMHGGLLCVEMGLCKTVQTVAVMLSLICTYQRSEKRIF